MKGLIQSAIIGGVLSLVPPIPKFKYDTPSLEKKAETEAIINGLRPAFFKGLVKVESNWNPHAKSSVDAQGLVQLMAYARKKLGVRNALDGFENLEVGAYWIGHHGVAEIKTTKEFNLAQWHYCGGNLYGKTIFDKWYKKTEVCGTSYAQNVLQAAKQY